MVRVKNASWLSYVFVLLLYVVLSTICSVTLRETLEDNALDLGQSLSVNYAYEMESNNRVYETLLYYAAGSIDSKKLSGWSDDEIIAWALDFFHQTNLSFGTDRLEAYMIYGGTYISENGVVSDGVDYTARPWWHDGGQVGFSGVYSDISSGERTITLSLGCQEADAVVAFDILIEGIDFSSGLENLPEGTSFFLADQYGQLILFESASPAAFTGNELQDYTDHMLEVISHDGNSITGIDGVERTLNCSLMANGWTAIVTMPYPVIFQDLNRLFIIFTSAFAIALALVVIYLYKQHRSQKEMRTAQDAIKVISDLYYAVYAVDWEKGEYIMIKGSDELRSRLARKGPYSRFLDVLEGLLEQEGFEEFRHAFSLDSIRDHVHSGTKSYGGDFRRLFTDQWRTINVMMIYDEDGPTSQAILCFRDVEDERRNEAAKRELLNQALQHAKDSARARQAFFSAMSHDMRTPLNAIIGLTTLAQGSSDGARTADYLGKISSSARQLLELVDDILEVGKTEHESFILEKRETDIVDTVEAALSPFRTMAESDHKELTSEYNVEDRLVLADSFRLTQILNNIVSNALKFTENGVGRISVRLDQHKNGTPVSQYVFRIEDNGLGMSSDFLEHIFEPYARETRFASQQIAGTGLGMPIVKNLVTQMSGEISVESRLSEGSVFTIRIPLEKAGSSAQAMTESGDSGEVSLDGCRLLVAEDNMINMEIMTEMLGQYNTEIVQAWNGQEALEAFVGHEAGYFDAILLDMQMPVMDGLEAARAIRASGTSDCLLVPIVAVTANAFAQDLARCREAGMDEHVSKPIDFRHLASTLSRLIGRRRRQGRT